MGAASRRWGAISSLAPLALLALSALSACDESPPSGASDAAGFADAANNNDDDAGARADAIPADATNNNEDAAPSDADQTDAQDPDGSTTDGGLLPLNRDRLCDEFTLAYCGAITACQCPAAIIARCEPEIRALCTQQLLSAMVNARIDDGTIIYDPIAARIFVNRLASTATTCADPFSGLGWTVGDYFTIGGIFTGTLAAGALCTIEAGPLAPSECMRGVCLEEGGELQCLRMAIPGELCEGASLCADLSEPLDPSLSLSDNLAAPCIMTSSSSPSMCSARQQNGSMCMLDFECASHRCSGVSCAARLADNEVCTRDVDCVSIACDTISGPPNVCEAGDVAAGMPCDRGPSCESDLCLDNICAPAVCAGLIR